MIQRRGFLAAILAAGAAPAIAQSGVLMPLGRVWVPPLWAVFPYQGPDNDALSSAMRKMERQIAETMACPPFRVYGGARGGVGKFITLIPKYPVFPRPGLHHDR